MFVRSLQVPHSDEAPDGVVVALLELEPDVAGDDLAVGLLDGRPAGAGGGSGCRPGLVDRPAKEVDGAALLGARVEPFGLQQVQRSPSFHFIFTQSDRRKVRLLRFMTWENTRVAHIISTEISSRGNVYRRAAEEILGEYREGRKTSILLKFGGR